MWVRRKVGVPERRGEAGATADRCKPPQPAGRKARLRGRAKLAIIAERPPRPGASGVRRHGQRPAITCGGSRPSSTAWQATGPAARACGQQLRDSPAGSARWRRDSADGTCIPAADRAGSAPRRPPPCAALPDISRSGTASSSMRVYGCCGVGEELARGRDLHDAAEVHHADAVGDVVHHCEIVRDEQIRERRGGAAGRASGSAPAPAPTRRAPRSARRRRGMRGSWTARGRSRCAAAGRRRTGADTWRRRRPRGPPARAAPRRSRPARCAWSAGACARIGSATMSATRQRGLRLAKGSWKIICMPLARATHRRGVAGDAPRRRWARRRR